MSQMPVSRIRVRFSSVVFTVLAFFIGSWTVAGSASEDDPCEAALQTSVLFRLVDGLGRSGLDPKFLEEWVARPQKSIPSFRQTVNSQQLPLVQGLQRWAQGLPDHEWPQVQEQVLSFLKNRTGSSVISAEARARTVNVVEPKLWRSVPTANEMDMMFAPISDGADNIWFGYRDRDLRLHLLDIQKGTDNIVNPVNLHHGQIENVSLISRGPGKMPFVQNVDHFGGTHRPNMVDLTLYYGTEPYIRKTSKKFSDASASMSPEARVLSFSGHERFAYRHLDYHTGGEIVDIAGKAPTLESKSAVLPGSFLKARDGRTLVAVVNLGGVSVQEYMGNEWREVAVLAGSHLCYPVLTEGPSGEIWVLVLAYGNLAKDKFLLKNISQADSPTWTAPFEHSNLLSDPAFVIDELGLPRLVVATHNHREHPEATFKSYRFSSDGSSTYTLHPRPDWEENYASVRWIHSPDGRPYILVRDMVSVRVYEPNSFVLLAKVPIEVGTHPHIVRTSANTYLVLRKDDWHIDFVSIFNSVEQAR